MDSVARKKVEDNDSTGPEQGLNTILVVDDDETIRDVLASALQRDNYHCLSAASAEEALEILGVNEVSLVISDIYMDGMSGLELLEAVKRIDPELPVILITGMADMDAAINSLKHGAYDFITKPFHVGTLSFSAARALEKRRFALERLEYQQFLEESVAARTAELKRANLDLIKALSEAIEAKDPYTRGHCNRVRLMSVEIAKAVGMSDAKVETLEYAALLHDIGKIAVPGRILNKPGPLSQEEFDVVKEHPATAEKMLKDLALVSTAAPSVRGHHERFDGAGYPDGIAGRDIPLEARIMAVADTYDAMTSQRPYRPPLSQEKAIQEIARCRGTQFDPEIADVFLDQKLYLFPSLPPGKIPAH